MAAISLEQGSHLTISKTKAGQFSNTGSHFGADQLRDDRVPVRTVKSGPEEFSGGFIDFLLGRGARYPR